MPSTSAAGCETLIVGAGPAGCAAGILLARAGRDVLIVDKALPRDKLCGGLLTEKAMRLLRQRLKLELPARVIGESSQGFEIFDGREFLNAAQSRYQLSFVFRDRFDAFLIEAARQAGCRVEAAEFQGLRGAAALVGGRELRCERIVGSDGVFSAVGRAVGKALPPRSLAVGLQVDVPRAGNPVLGGLHAARIFFGYLRLGWGWAFPKGDWLSIGLGGIPGTKEDVAETFRRLLEDCGVADARNLKVRGAKLPNEAFLSEPAAGRVWLCGDAAGFAEPLTGEGIAFALHSGALAAESMLAGGDCAARYNEACRREITPVFGQARWARNLLLREPFRSLAMRRFRGGTGSMQRFLRVLAGESDYKRFFSESLLGR
ncbi:MAG: geranylgeranyl reductase family protein [Elusimicrobia bacterium]|nr:geranylgeranyl reductase family protein [Elusimicrobiota bacterium]